MTDEVLDLCFSDEEDRRVALAVQRSTSSDFNHRPGQSSGRSGSSQSRGGSTNGSRSKKKKKKKRRRATPAPEDVIELDKSVDDLTEASPALPRTRAVKRKAQLRQCSNSDVEIVGEASPPPKAARNGGAKRPGGLISGADFVSDDQIHATASNVLRRSEVSTQDYEFERSRLADLAKEHKKRNEEATKHKAEVTLVRARSFLEHHAQECKNRFAKYAVSSPSSHATSSNNGSSSTSGHASSSTGSSRATTKSSTSAKDASLKIRFPTAKTEQLTLPGSAPLSVLFDFCDAKLFEHAANASADADEAEGSLAEDLASVLAKHSSSSSNTNNNHSGDGFSQLPDRYSYGLQIIGRKPVWIRRPASTSSSESAASALASASASGSTAQQAATWTIASAGLRGRMVLVVGQPPPLAALGHTGLPQKHKSDRLGTQTSGGEATLTPWDVKFELLSQFRRKTGHCNVPETHPALGMWVVTQRAAYEAVQDREAGRPVRSRATILPSQVSQLEKLGFTWKTK